MVKKITRIDKGFAQIERLEGKYDQAEGWEPQ
jgi:hypothetical protein